MIVINTEDGPENFMKKDHGGFDEKKNQIFASLSLEFPLDKFSTFKMIAYPENSQLFSFVSNKERNKIESLSTL